MRKQCLWGAEDTASHTADIQGPLAVPSPTGRLRQLTRITLALSEMQENWRCDGGEEGKRTAPPKLGGPGSGQFLREVVHRKSTQWAQ